MPQGHEAGICYRDSFPCVSDREKNGKIPFLDCLVMCDNNNNLRTTSYGKPTHIDILYIAYSTNHLTTLLLTR